MGVHPAAAGIEETGLTRGVSGEGEVGAEDRLRQQVAACTLILNDLDIIGYSGHVSGRLSADRFLIQSFDHSRAEVTPGDLLVCDLEGHMISGPAGVRPPAEVYLHCEIFRVRPDVQAIAHFHHDLANTFTLVRGRTLRPVKNHAVRWTSGIPVHADPSHVSDATLGAGVARTLGNHHAMQIRAHGQIVAAESVPALLVDTVHFVENAVALYQASLLGEVEPLTEEEVAAFAREFKRNRHVAKLWKYYAGRAVAKGLFPQAWSDAAA